MTEEAKRSNQETLALPAPGDEYQQAPTQTLNVVEGTTIQMDQLGPIIGKVVSITTQQTFEANAYYLSADTVNSDGTLSRISNWHDMTPAEQERTVRLVAKRRNRDRMEALKQKEEAERAGRSPDQSGEGPPQAQ